MFRFGSHYVYKRSGNGFPEFAAVTGLSHRCVLSIYEMRLFAKLVIVAYSHHSRFTYHTILRQNEFLPLTGTTDFVAHQFYTTFAICDFGFLTRGRTCIGRSGRTERGVSVIAESNPSRDEYAT